MAEFRTVRMSFWHDPFIEELDTKAKLLYLYLFTSQYTNNLGVLEVTRKKIAYETGLSVSEVDKCLESFSSQGKIVADEKENIIFLCNFIKHQTSTSPKILEGLQKISPSIPSPIIAKAICIRYPQVYGVNKDASDTISIPYADGTHTLSIPSGEIGSWNREVGIGNCEEGGASAPPPCPHKKIVALYHEALPEHQRVEMLNEKRKGLMNARWGEVGERLRAKEQDDSDTSRLAWLRHFFSVAAKSDFLTGKKAFPDGGVYMVDFDKLMSPSGFVGVVEGKYNNREGA